LKRALLAVQFARKAKGRRHLVGAARLLEGEADLHTGGTVYAAKSPTDRQRRPAGRAISFLQHQFKIASKILLVNHCAKGEGRRADLRFAGAGRLATERIGHHEIGTDGQGADKLNLARLARPVVLICQLIVAAIDDDTPRHLERAGARRAVGVGLHLILEAHTRRALIIDGGFPGSDEAEDRRLQWIFLVREVVHEPAARIEEETINGRLHAG